MLATSIEKVPTGNRWLHKIKFDGYRLMARRAGTYYLPSCLIISAHEG